MAVVQRMAVVHRLVQNTRLSYTRFSRAGDSGRPLLTGGRCSEVAVSTGLTVYCSSVLANLLLISSLIVWLIYL